MSYSMTISFVLTYYY